MVKLAGKLDLINAVLGKRGKKVRFVLVPDWLKRQACALRLVSMSLSAGDSCRLSHLFK